MRCGGFERELEDCRQQVGHSLACEEAWRDYLACFSDRSCAEARLICREERRLAVELHCANAGMTESSSGGG